MDPVYLIVWMDGIVFKVRDNGKIINKTVYLCVGLKQNGLKEVLGMWVGKSESSSFWMGVLTDLKARGVQDILITCTDNLNGFTDIIRAVFPLSSTQIRVVYQIRNSCKYVVYKDKKEFTADMKNIYNAPNKEVAATELDNLEKKWGGKYPYAIRKHSVNHVKMGNGNIITSMEERKHSVNHVFSSPTSIINFTSKKPSYDDTRRSGRDNELLQRAQNDL